MEFFKFGNSAPGSIRKKNGEFPGKIHLKYQRSFCMTPTSNKLRPIKNAVTMTTFIRDSSPPSYISVTLNGEENSFESHQKCSKVIIMEGNFKYWYHTRCKSGIVHLQKWLAFLLYKSYIDM